MVRQERNFSYDFARFLALLMVIGVHSLPGEYWVIVAGQALLFACNGIFFLMSGHFNLRERKESDLPGYYYKKLRNIFVPVVVYTCVTTVWNSKNQLLDDPLKIARSCFDKIVTSNIDTHLWFVYTVLGFLLVAPFLAHMVTHMGNAERTWFFALGIGYCSLVFLGANTGHSFSWRYPIDLWLFLFLCAPLVCDELDRRCSTPVLLLVSLACCGTLSLLCDRGWGTHIFDINPFYIIECLCLYLLFLRMGKAVGHSKVISFVAKRQFGIYIIHLFMLHRVYDKMPDTSMLPWFVSWPLYILAALALSLVGVLIIDTVVLHPVQWLLDRIYGLVSQKPQQDAA